jgi:hypothetical protein
MIFHLPGFSSSLLTFSFLAHSDHVNDYCSLSTHEDGKPALWMCYAGGAGFGGYGGYGGYYRRVRVFDFDMNEARVTTWKRVEAGVEEGATEKRVDEQIIVDAGHPVAPILG